MDTTTITLDTPLAALDFDEASQWMPSDLIADELMESGECAWAWARVERMDGTVRDLREDLIAHNA